MTDIHPVHRKIYDNGFARGSSIAILTVMAYLDAHGHASIADQVQAASNSGDLERYRPQLPLAATPAEAERPAPLPAAAFEPGPMPKMTSEQARGSGYTGNQCIPCGSMRMTVSGHCEKCEDCGESSGCS